MHTTASDFPHPRESAGHTARFLPPRDWPQHDTAALRLRVAGLDHAERDLLQSILVVLEQRTERPWHLTDGADADLFLHTRETAAPAHRDALVGVFVREGETPPAHELLQVALPLRVMSVLDALNAAHDRLSQRRLASAPGACAPSPAVDDGRTVAAALARMAASRSEQALRVRIVGFGTLWAHPFERRYAIDFAYERLSDALEQHRYVMTALSHDAATQDEPADPRPIDELLWRTGLQTPWEHPADPGMRYRLRRWPDLTRLPHRAEHIVLCAALAAHPSSLDELLAATGVAAADRNHLLHACALCGYVEAVPHESAAPPRIAAPATTGLGGLFDRLRRKLGF